MGLDIKADGGVIIVQPTLHPEGGEYRWVTTGEIPELPLPLPEMLDDTSRHESAATDAEVEAFLNANTGNEWPSLIKAWRKQFADATARFDSRHDTMVAILPGAMEEAMAGYIPARESAETLRKLFVEAKTQQYNGSAPLSTAEAEDEFANMLAWAIGQAQNHTAEEIRERFTRKLGPQQDSDTDPDPDPGFWTRRKSLERIHQFAQARRVGPWGVLGSALVRVICHVPPQVRLPATIGTTMSLNMFVALVGASGVGKDGCDGCARDAVTFQWVTEVAELPLGSGEGIARALERDADGNQDPVLFTAPEIETVAKLFARQSATLEPELRKLYCGQLLGFSNAQKHTRTLVPAHSYRAGLSIGVQPNRSDALLKGEDGGTPQRFIWMPVDDKDAPDIRPVDVAAWKVKLPKLFDPAMQIDGVQQYVELQIPDVARDEIERHRLTVLRGGPVDPLDGHKLLCRLKVAVALMFLESDDRAVVSDEDWELAGHVMAVSDKTRQRVIEARSAKARWDNKARALAAEEHDTFVTDRRLERTREAILRWLDKADGEPVSRRDLRNQRIKYELRAHFDPAVAELLDEGLIKEVELEQGTGYVRCANGSQ